MPLRVPVDDIGRPRFTVLPEDLDRALEVAYGIGAHSLRVPGQGRRKDKILLARRAGMAAASIAGWQTATIVAHFRSKEARVWDARKRNYAEGMLVAMAADRLFRERLLRLIHATGLEDRVTIPVYDTDAFVTPEVAEYEPHTTN